MTNIYSANIAAQCLRLLHHLKQRGSITTVQARHELDIVAPAARIFQLRHEWGFNIVTVWVNEENPGGGIHRFAKYILRPGRYGQTDKKVA